MTELERICCVVMGCTTLGLIVLLFAWLVIRHETQKPTAHALVCMRDTQALEIANHQMDLQRQRYTVLQYENECLRNELQSAYGRIREQGATLAMFQDAILETQRRQREAQQSRAGTWRVVF